MSFSTALAHDMAKPPSKILAFIHISPPLHVPHAYICRVHAFGLLEFVYDYVCFKNHKNRGKFIFSCSLSLENGNPLISHSKYINFLNFPSVQDNRWFHHTQ